MNKDIFDSWFNSQNFEMGMCDSYDFSMAKGMAKTAWNQALEELTINLFEHYTNEIGDVIDRLRAS